MTSGSESRKVLITGGTGSVGRTLVQKFCQMDAEVVFQYHTNSDEAEKLVNSCRAEGFSLDLARDFRLPRNDFDIVVNNAGVNISDELSHNVSMDDWNRTLAVNVTAVFRIAQACLPHMMENRWGRIINVSSIYGLRGVEYNLPYNVSKHALSGLTKTIAKEYAPYGITCNEICPGPIESEMMTRIGRKEAADEGITVAGYFEEICREIPAGRLAIPEDVAVLCAFLSSSEAGYINGVSIPLDGGKIS